MGIKHYSIFLNRHFSDQIAKIKRGESVASANIDNLLIDMNGIFHASAQRVYQYGNHKPPKSLLVKPFRSGLKTQTMMFQDVCKTVENLFDIVKPNKRLILCVDGPAPFSKQCIAKGTLVSLENGEFKPIENIVNGDRVFGWNGNCFTVTETLGLQVKGEKNTIKMTMSNGFELVCTPDHLILVLFNDNIIWREAGKLKNGDMVIADCNQYSTDNCKLPSALQIISIKDNGKVPVFDIEVEDNHSFLANGICVHNCQQRLRRFRSAKESSGESVFDTCSITPGTKFMDFLSKYIDWYIRKRISESVEWQNIEVIFSNEKVEGEGELKLLSFIRQYGTDDETYCINGLDADLIQLSLCTHKPKFFVLRDELYTPGIEYQLINIGEIRKKLTEIMKWESENFKFNERDLINDFVFLCFMSGNDFLPHIPSIEIIQNGIEMIIDIYKEVGQSYGHITSETENNVLFNHTPLKILMMTIGMKEKIMYEQKLLKKDNFFPDILLENCAKYKDRHYDLDIEKYNSTYCSEKFGDTPIKTVCHDYLEGMQWVLTYYTKHNPSWKWLYKYHYAPPASEIAKYIDSFEFVKYEISESHTPFQQLLSILPPKSSYLIPEPINKLLSIEPLKQFCPDDFYIDLAGKRKEWEGVPILPFIDNDLVSEIYNKHKHKISQQDNKRNILGKSYVYSFDSNNNSIFKSFYGDILNCCVKTKIISL